MDETNRVFELKCKSCGGELLIQEGQQNVIVCPYCGSKEIIIEDKDVVIERLRNDSVRRIMEVKKEELQRERELEAEQEAKREAEDFKWSKMFLLMAACAALSAIFAAQEIGYSWFTGFFFVIDTGLFLYVILTKLNIIKPKRRERIGVLTFMAFVLFLLLFFFRFY